MMGHLERQDSGIGYHTGCMWGILHILDYHHWHRHWHHAKRLPLRRRHGRGKHAICCRNPKTFSFEHCNDGVEEYLDAEAVPLLDEQQTTTTRSTNGMSSKPPVEELIGKEMSARSRLQQMDYIGHFEPSDHYLGGPGTDWVNPIIILHKSADIAGSGMQVPSGPKTSDHLVGTKNLNRGISCPQFKECVDVLEIFKVNKNSFMEILEDPKLNSEKNFYVQTSNKRLKLKKCGSFPAAESSHFRYARPSTLEDKQKEIWSFTKGEKFHGDTQESKSVASKFSQDSREKSIGVKVYDGGDQEGKFSFHASSPGVNKHGWHLSFVSHFREFKKKIKHALKESKKENYRATTNALLHRVPSGFKLSSEGTDSSKRFKEMKIEHCGTENHRSCHRTDASDSNLSEGIRRTSSLHDSVGRYSQLFDYTFSREANWYLYQSKSLKLSNEEKPPSYGHNLKSFRRRLSLPDLDSLFPFPLEARNEYFHSKKPIRFVKDCDTKRETDSRDGLKLESIPADRKQCELLEAVEETAVQEDRVEAGNRSKEKEYSGGLTVGIDDKHTKTGETHEEVADPGNEEQNPHLNEVNGSTKNFSRECEVQTPISVFQPSSQDDVTGPLKLPASGGSEFDPEHICIHEADSFVDLQERSCNDSLAVSCSSENLENENMTGGNRLHHLESSRLDHPDLCYVRHVLEVSGFTKSENLGAWYSLDQPLNPTLFKELEVSLHQQVGCSSDEIDYNNCDHQFLFDLINEELLEMYESSLAYFPKTFSFTRHTRVLPKGSRVVEEVWKRIEWQRSSRSEMESLDDIVGRDFAKRDGWMNLQMDAEDTAIELEDWIFDELLEEVIC